MLMIIIHHIVLVWGGPSYMHFTMTWGVLGTGMFFLLSGFGLFLSLSKKNDLSFHWLLEKTVKLIGPFIFAFVFYVLCALALNRSEVNVDMLTCLCQIRIPNTTSWFLKAILALYIVTFLIFKTKLSNRNRVCAILALTIFFFCIACKFLSAEWYWSILNFPAGMVIALNFNKLKNAKIPYLALIVLLSPLFFFFLKYGLYVVASLAFSCLLVAIMVFVNVRNRLFKYIGKQSINFYLFQMIPLHFCLFLCSNLASYALLVIISTYILSLVYDFILFRVK